MIPTISPKKIHARIPIVTPSLPTLDARLQSPHHHAWLSRAFVTLRFGHTLYMWRVR